MQRTSPDGTRQLWTSCQSLIAPGHFHPQRGERHFRSQRANLNSRQCCQSLILKRYEIGRNVASRRSVKCQPHVSWMGNSSLTANVSLTTAGVYCLRSNEAKRSCWRLFSSRSISWRSHADRAWVPRSSSIFSYVSRDSVTVARPLDGPRAGGGDFLATFTTTIFVATRVAVNRARQNIRINAPVIISADIQTKSMLNQARRNIATPSFS